MVSGLCLAGPFDLLLDSSLVPVAGVLFAVSALVLLVLEVILFGRAASRSLRAPHWVPPAVGLAGIALSALGLLLTRWNVHLHGPRVLFFMVTFVVASVGTVIILGASVWALFTQRGKGRGFGQDTG
jgi:hypothetical protein